MSTAATWQTESTSSDATEKLAEQLGKNLRGGEVIELVSDLGGGKTTFVRGLARGAGSSNHVASPTFTISRVYKVKAPELTHSDAPLGAAAERKRGVHDSTVSAHRKAATTRSAETTSGVDGSAGKQAGGVREIWHFDFYRLQDAGIIADELAEFMHDPSNVVVIEWGGLVQNALPEDRLTVNLKNSGETKRKIEINCPAGLKYLLSNLSD